MPGSRPVRIEHDAQEDRARTAPGRPALYETASKLTDSKPGRVRLGPKELHPPLMVRDGIIQGPGRQPAPQRLARAGRP